MTDDPTQALETASREATNWLILLQDDPDDPDLQKEFAAWVNASPLHFQAWQATGQVDGLIRDSIPEFQNVWGRQGTLAKPAITATAGMSARPAGRESHVRRGWGALAGM
ncbi:MAG TPA: hypothetical protein DCG04_13880, partial [Rhodospirillaceae bacterium]|nr:hypothetical protein [Rhodospirillaceae bacterium]